MKLTSKVQKLKKKVENQKINLTGIQKRLDTYKITKVNLVQFYFSFSYFLNKFLEPNYVYL